MTNGPLKEHSEMTHHEMKTQKLLPCCECRILSFGWIPGTWILWTDVSEHSVHLTYDPWWWNGHSVPKCRHIKFRHRVITQKAHMTYEDGVDRLFCEMSAHKIQMPGKHHHPPPPKKRIQQDTQNCTHIHTNKKLIRWKYHIHRNNFYKVIILNTDETTNATAVNRIFLLFPE